MMTPATTARLHPVRMALLDLHRSMLEAERLAWQRLNGRVVTNAEMLQLTIHDPWFAWLRPLTKALVALDDAMMDRSLDAEPQAPALVGDLEALLHPDESGTEFQQRYYEFLQRSPDVAVSHAVAVKAITDAKPRAP
jgi:hypothetical protein